MREEYMRKHEKYLSELWPVQILEPEILSLLLSTLPKHIKIHEKWPPGLNIYYIPESILPHSWSILAH